MYNILVILMFSLFAIVSTVLVFYAYQYGIKTGLSLSKGEPLPAVTISEKKKEKEVKLLVEEEDRKQHDKEAKEIQDIEEALDMNSLYKGVRNER